MVYILLAIIAFSPLACTLIYLRHADRKDEKHHKLLASLADGYREDSERWQVERRELLNRVQRPSFTPVAPTSDYLIPEREPDETNRVGEITISDDYYFDAPLTVDE